MLCLAFAFTIDKLPQIGLAPKKYRPRQKPSNNQETETLVGFLGCGSICKIKLFVLTGMAALRFSLSETA